MFDKVIVNILFVLLSTAACGSESTPNGSISTENVVEIVKFDLMVDVSFIAFEFEPITGYHEEDFPRVGCNIKLNRETFVNLLMSHSGKPAFEPYDIKSVINDGSVKYLIDNNGTVLKDYSYLYSIDKKIFTEIVIGTDGCRPDP